MSYLRLHYILRHLKNRSVGCQFPTLNREP